MPLWQVRLWQLQHKYKLTYLLILQVVLDSFYGHIWSCHKSEVCKLWPYVAHEVYFAACKNSCTAPSICTVQASQAFPNKDDLLINVGKITRWTKLKWEITAISQQHSLPDTVKTLHCSHHVEKSAMDGMVYRAYKWNQLTWCLIQSFQQAADVGAYAPWRPQQ